jgi:hypothetical protein
MMDANQRWDVPEAVEWTSKLAEFKPLWIEEPTSLMTSRACRHFQGRKTTASTVLAIYFFVLFSRMVITEIKIPSPVFYIS